MPLCKVFGMKPYMRMNKVLWTKTTIQDEVIAKLDEGFQNDFLEVIAIKRIVVSPFNLKGYSLIFTSENAVKSFFENGFRLDGNVIYTVGKRTQEMLQERGGVVYGIQKNAELLAEFILKNASEERFLHFCGNLALSTLEARLVHNGIGYEKICVYQTELCYPKIHKEYDAVCFFSPSGVNSFFAHNSVEGKMIFSIGYTTEKAIRKYTTQNIITSSENNLEDLIHLVKIHYIQYKE